MKTEKPILDPCCGGRMFYFDKQNPHVLFCDNREFEGALGRTCPNICGVANGHLRLSPT